MWTKTGMVSALHPLNQRTHCPTFEFSYVGYVVYMYIVSKIIDIKLFRDIYILQSYRSKQVFGGGGWIMSVYRLCSSIQPKRVYRFSPRFPFCNICNFILLIIGDGCHMNKKKKHKISQIPKWHPFIYFSSPPSSSFSYAKIFIFIFEDFFFFF